MEEDTSQKKWNKLNSGRNGIRGRKSPTTRKRHAKRNMERRRNNLKRLFGKLLFPITSCLLSSQIADFLLNLLFRL